MTAITIKPKNKKELAALKYFIKALDLSYDEIIPKEKTVLKKNKEMKKNNTETIEKAIENSYTLEEFSKETTSFLEGLTWKK